LHNGLFLRNLTKYDRFKPISRNYRYEMDRSKSAVTNNFWCRQNVRQIQDGRTDGHDLFIIHAAFSVRGTRKTASFKMLAGYQKEDLSTHLGIRCMNMRKLEP